MARSNKVWGIQFGVFYDKLRFSNLVHETHKLRRGHWTIAPDHRMADLEVLDISCLFIHSGGGSPGRPGCAYSYHTPAIVVRFNILKYPTKSMLNFQVHSLLGETIFSDLASFSIFPSSSLGSRLIWPRPYVFCTNARTVVTGRLLKYDPNLTFFLPL